MRKTIGTLAALTAGAAMAIAPTTGSAHAASIDDRSASVARYTPGSPDDSRNAQLRDRLATVLKQGPQQRGTAQAAATTVYYSTSGAPSYASLIRQSASVWNSRVSNVRLVEASASTASLDYYEGNDSRGSYAYTNGHGSGYIFLDYSQMSQYSQLRIVTHETGHAYGLPDNYSGPCSELMSGGGPGPSCTNAYPNSTEVYKVNQLWANGFTASGVKATVNPAAFARP